MKERICGVMARICGTREPICDMKARICGLKERICDINARLCGAKARICGIKARICGLKARLRDIIIIIIVHQSDLDVIRHEEVCYSYRLKPIRQMRGNSPTWRCECTYIYHNPY